MLEKQNTTRRLKTIHLLQYFVISAWINNVYQNKATFAMQFAKISRNLKGENLTQTKPKKP